MLEQVSAAEATRVTITQVVGVMAAVVGLLIFLTAPDHGPSFDILGRTEVWPEAAGLLLSIMGVILVVSITKKKERLAARVLTGMIVWDLALAAGFLTQWIVFASENPRADPSPSVFQVGIYAGLAAISWVLSDAAKRAAELTSHEVIAE